MGEVPLYSVRGPPSAHHNRVTSPNAPPRREGERERERGKESAGERGRNTDRERRFQRAW